MNSVYKAVVRWLAQLGHDELGDFTATLRVVPISALAVGIGVMSALVALVLLRLIGLFTNLFFYGRWDTAFVSPAGHHLGPLVVFIPVVGALIIGLMARYGSERIRGHGIPEAIEAILSSGSRRSSQGGDPQAAVVGDLDRLGGPVRRRGPDHHDGRRIRVDDRQFFI